MSRFKVYSPEQAYLLPPSVRDELGERHLCIFVRDVVERLDRSVFEPSYSAEGGELYAPELMLGVWLYAYALGITSARQVERRLVEDLGFRYLRAGARVDNWALSAFRRRHNRALNDAFTQVLEIAVSDDHLMVAQRVTQNATDNALLAPMIDQVEQRCGAPPGAALADSGFFSIANIEQMEQRHIDAYVPDSNLACELNLGSRCRAKARAAAHRRMRAKLAMRPA